MDLSTQYTARKTFDVSKSPAEEDSDLWLSTRIVSCLLIACGFLCILASETAGTNSTQGLALALVLYLAAGAVEMAWKQQPLAARYVATTLVSILIPLSMAVWRSPEMLSMVTLPVVIGMAVLGSRGATIATIVTSGSFLLLITLGDFPLSPNGTVMVLFVALLVCVTLVIAYRPILQMASWARTYIYRAQVLLDEARDRNAELNETLDTLMHVNRQLDITNEKLAAARQIAERAQESKADFVAKVSHEFRTPLNMIIGLSEFLVRQMDSGGRRIPEDVARDIRVIHRNSTHLSSMINDVLNLSQLDAGHLILRKQWVMVANAIGESVDVVLPLLEKKGLRVEVVLKGEIPDIYCDPVRIRQVILNLVSNAARHTDVGHVRIEAETIAGYVQVSVADTGTGIAPDRLDRIFEPFFHEDRSGGIHDQGSGLGLTVCKQLIEQHDGSLWVTSEVSKGSTFYFKLPIVPYAMPFPSASGWINEEWIWMQRDVQGDLPRSGSWWRIIVCDRTGRAHSLLATHTTGDVELVETQDLAETCAQISEMPAHLVVVQEEDPTELWRKVREARLRITDTPIVGCALPSGIEHPTTPEVADYLVKPVTRSDLRDALGNLPQNVRKILIVDDDPEIGALFSRMLLDIEPEIQTLALQSGEAALEWMQHNQCDLVLMDLYLPDRDGWTILREKQTIAHMRDVPVLIISAQDSDGPIKNAAMLILSSADGIQGGFIVETAFRLAASPREASGKRASALKENHPV